MGTNVKPRWDRPKMKITLPAQHSPTLDQELEAVLARLCDRLGSLCKTQAVKLPYIVDVVAMHVLGRPITKATHQAWMNGVVTKEAYAFVTHHGDDGVFHVSAGGPPVGTRLHLIGKADASLSEEELAVIDFVADEFGHLTFQHLGLLTKRMNTHLSVHEWGANAPVAMGEDAYERLSWGWQHVCALISKADLEDQSQWSEPIQDDPLAHFKRLLNA